MAISNDAHWRDSARSVKLFIWDGKTAFPLIIFLIHMSWLTFGIAFGSIFFFTVLNYFGFKAEVFLRMLRNAIAGPHKAVIPWWSQ